MTFKLKLITTFILASLSGWLTAACENRQAPLCPDKGAMILNELYPNAAFIVSTASRSYDSTEKMSQNFIISVMEAYDFDSKTLPALIIPTSKQDYDTLNKEINLALEKKKISKSTRTELLKSLRHIETKSYLWQQDYLQAYFDEESGAPIAGIVSRYDRTPIGVERGITNLKFNCAPEESRTIGTSQIMRPHSAIGGMDFGSPQLGGQFGIPNRTPPGADIEQWYEGEPGSQNSKMGGNIESLPGGICLTGNNMSDEYLSEWCRDPKMAIKVDTSWLTVGHVDELIKLVPSNQGSAPCNFAVMVASPDKAFEILKNDPHQTFYTFPNEGVSSSDSNLMSKLTPSSFPGEVMCKLYNQSIRDMINQGENSEHGNGAKIKGATIFNLLISNSYASSDFDLCYQELARMKTITNGQYYRALNEDEELLITNRLIQEKMNRTKKYIAEKLKMVLPQCKNTSFIDVPNIFAVDGLVDGKKGKELPIPGSGNSILPNPTNSVVASKTVIFPNPNNLSFKAYLSREMDKLKMKSSFVDTWDTSHLGHGNLHCITNNLNYCRPRK